VTSKQLGILILLLVFNCIIAYPQDLPVACVGSRVRYAANPSLPNSTFNWVIKGAKRVEMTPAKDTVDITWSNEPGTYVLGISEVSEFGCVGDTVFSLVSVQGALVDIGPDQKICQGDTAYFDAGDGWSDVVWKNNTHYREFFDTRSDTVWVTATTESKCTSSDTAVVTVFPKPVLDLGPDTSICGVETLTLNAGYGNVQWSNGIITPSFTLNVDSFNIGETRSFWVKVRNSAGCTSLDTISVTRCNPLTFQIPVAFTPTGSHPVWELKFLEFYPKATVEVFDRWGRLVYRSVGYSQPWNGKSNGQTLPTDSYLYIINLNDGSMPIYGTVTLLR
jgi:gliding motility-associated-like protein